MLAATSGALPEVVGDAALLLEPCNPAQMAACIDDFLADVPLQRQMQQAGPKRASQFSWTQTAAELTDRLRQLQS